MSEYSVTSPHDTYMGDLVHRAKYGDTRLDERHKAADELSERMMSFINDLYSGASLPFTACITAPSHNPKPLDLSAFLCKRISHDFGLQDGTDLWRHSTPVASVKTLADGRDRFALLCRSMRVEPADLLPTPRGILFVDDVYETGATARAACEAIRVHNPEQEFHIITLTRRPARTVESQ